MKSSRLEIVCRSVEEIPSPVRVQGANSAAQALIVAGLARRRKAQGHKTPIVVLAPSDEAASELAADLESLGQAVFRQTPSVSHFPAWEQSPYSSIAPSIRIRLARLSVLSQLA